MDDTPGVFFVEVSRETKEILSMQREHKRTWREAQESVWVKGLIVEVLELLLALIGLHAGPVDHELAQIASICMNWREYRRERLINDLLKRSDL